MTATYTGAPELSATEKIDRLDPTTEAGFAALVAIGKSLVRREKQTNWDLGDLAVKAAPAVPAYRGDWPKAFPGSAEAEDVKRLRELAEAIDYDLEKLHDLHKVAKNFPPSLRNPDIAFYVYKTIMPNKVAGKDVGGQSADMWVDSFFATHGRWPLFWDAREAIGQKTPATREIDKAPVKDKVSVVTTLVEDPEVAAAVKRLVEEPSLDDGTVPSSTLALSPQVLGVEKTLDRTFAVLREALDNVDLIAASSSSGHIAMLAGHVAREAQALADVLLLDPSKA